MITEEQLKEKGDNVIQLINHEVETHLDRIILVDWIHHYYMAEANMQDVSDTFNITRRY